MSIDFSYYTQSHDAGVTPLHTYDVVLPRSAYTDLRPRSFLPVQQLSTFVREPPERSASIEPVEPLPDGIRKTPLPRDILYYLLRFMLVAKEPITNPWTLGAETFKFLGARPSAPTEPEFRYHLWDRVVLRHSWSKYLRPALLATCREFHNEGMRYLYRLNTFRFTRLMSQLGPEDWSNFVGFRSLARPDAFSEFLSVRHKSIDAENPPTRLHLIQRLSIEDSDDAGPWILPVNWPAFLCSLDHHINNKLTWQFHMINRLEAWGAKFAQLVLIFDEDEAKTSDHLWFETRVRKLRSVTFDSTTRNFTLESISARQQEHNRYYSFHWMVTQTNEDMHVRIGDNHSWTRRYIMVENLTIRGTTRDLPCDPSRRDYSQGPPPPPTNPAAILVEEWLAETDIRFPDSTEHCVVPPSRVYYTGKLGSQADNEFMEKTNAFLRD